MALVYLDKATTEAEAQAVYDRWKGIPIDVLEQNDRPAAQVRSAQLLKPRNLVPKPAAERKVKTPLQVPPASSATPQRALPPSAPTPEDPWTLCAVRLPVESDYYHTHPCEFPDGRGCWFSVQEGRWFDYDPENPALAFTHWRPRLRPPQTPD